MEMNESILYEVLMKRMIAKLCKIIIMVYNIFKYHMIMFVCKFFSKSKYPQAIFNRKQFIELADNGNSCLEIGPFDSPLLLGVNIEYFDVLSQQELQLRALQHGRTSDGVPFIHYVSKFGNLDVVDKKFNSVISSHVIEHQTDLVRHLQAIERILEENGKYYLIIPDKRYCFDSNLAESNLAQVLAAFVEARTRHKLESVLEHRCLTTHNNPYLHLFGMHGSLDFNNLGGKFQRAIDEFTLSEDYLDVHAWYFTPKSFVSIIRGLNILSLVNLRVDKIYSTPYGELEFCVILTK